MASIFGADVLGGLRGLLGEFLDLVGDHGEALAGLAGACRLDGRVEREQVRLLGDAGDHLDDLADLGGALAQLADDLGGQAGRLDGLIGDVGRVACVVERSP